MRITFYGACEEVSGSNFLLEACGKKILFDCGLFQGNKIADERNYAPFAYDPGLVDVVIICHAHLDHTGRLPKLVKEGFRGIIIGTEPTRDLTKLVLDDNEKLMSEECERENRQPLYGRKDVNRVIELFRTISYHQTIEIASGVKLTFKNAGHILGSAIAIIDTEDQRLVYTSDLGNSPTLLLDPPEFVDSSDWVVCESTYGGRIHEDSSLRQEELASIIRATVAENGVLLIPTFAIERTQELLHDIEHFCQKESCEKLAIFLDSPLASRVTEVFGKYPNYLSERIRQEHRDKDFFGLERLQIMSTVEESKQINLSPNPKIIIAGSGMMNGGRILFHAKRYLDDRRNTLLIVAYQAQGTLGRRLFDGEKQIKIFDEKIQVKANIESIGSYSSHADMPQLLNWIGKVKGCRGIFVIHGEKEQASILAREIKSKLHVGVNIPTLSKSYMI